MSSFTVVYATELLYVSNVGVQILVPEEMTRRAVLKEHIHEAWRRTIDSEYNSRLINKEAALQAYLVNHLGDVFQEADVSRQIFVEPPLRLGNRDDGFRTYIPDVIVCSKRKIIGLIELKYAPRGMPQYATDLEKLKTIF